MFKGGSSPFRSLSRFAFVAVLGSVLTGWAATFPLPAPTRPTSFPLIRPILSGSVLAWGGNSFGQTTLPPQLGSDVVAVAGGGYIDRAHSVALRSDGTVVAWGSNESGQSFVPDGLNGVVAISAGLAHTLALKDNGTVIAWGLNGYGQASVPVALGDAVAIACGHEHSLALRKDGTVAAWGRAWDFGQTKVPANLTNVVAIAAGEQHSVALKADGTVVAWGGNTFQQTNVPQAARSDVVGVTAGRFHTLALKRDGNVVSWGALKDVPAYATNAVQIATGAAHRLVLKGNRTIVAWGSNSQGQTNILDGTVGVVAIAAGFEHSLAIAGPLHAVPFAVIGVSRVTVAFGAIVGRQYQFQNSRDLLHWAPSGSDFIAESESVAREFVVAEVGSYFRVVEVP